MKTNNYSSYSNYSKEALDIVKSSNFLTDTDWKELDDMQDSLQDNWEKHQQWRTETEIQTSVLNDIKFPTKASKYWQANRESTVFFENLVTLSFDYRRNNVEIKRLKLKIKTALEFDKEDFEIDLEEAIFKKKNMELAAKDRMRELKIWKGIQEDLDDGSFNTVDVNEHQLKSYTQRYLKEVNAVAQSGANMSNSEATNLLGQTMTMVRKCEEKGILDEVINESLGTGAGKTMSLLGYNKTDKQLN